jgi:hypothetical protein
VQKEEMMKRVSFGAVVILALVVGLAVLVVDVPAETHTHVVAPSEVRTVVPPPMSKAASDKAVIGLNVIDDCGDAADWSYICEMGVYQAWFAIDVSSIAPGTSLDSMTFTAFMENQSGVLTERSLWYSANDSWVGVSCPGTAAGDVLVGTVAHAAAAGYNWVTIDVDLSAHDFQSDLTDGTITFMLTGPTDGSHDCGMVDLEASGNVPYVVISTLTLGNIPTAGTLGLLLFVVLLSTAGFLLLRR